MALQEHESEPMPLSLARTALVAFAVVAAAIAGLIMIGLSFDWWIGHSDPSLFGTVGNIVASSVGGGMLFLLLRRRQPGRYLGLTHPQPRDFGLGLLAGLGFAALFAAVGWLATGDRLDPAWIDIYTSSGHNPTLLVLSMLVATPLFEECLLRGLLHRGLAASRLGATGAIGVISVLSMLIQSPGSLIAAFHALGSAVILGVIRERTGSIVTGLAIRVLEGVILLTAASVIVGHVGHVGS
jgi:membrane protease YdiL (CAAX protease family)